MSCIGLGAADEVSAFGNCVHDAGVGWIWKMDFLNGHDVQ